jgi:CheY-like chemotaxis protein
MLELIDRALGERISVHTRYPADPWSVWADSSLLENAILNLCVNARDAMAGGGQLTIAIDNVAVADDEVNELQGGEYVRISVSDTGAGIAPEHLDRVFDPFFTTKPVGKGTGLGLSQIFGFARQSGGAVAIQSALGSGTSVAVYLPRAFVEARAASQQGEPRASAAVNRPGAVVLVVEDDARVRRATVASLEELGYCPIACASGAEGLRVLDDHPETALVISDVMMPEMTGPELVRKVLQRRPDMAVLFVTGFVGDADEAGDLSGHRVLRKPFTVAALEAAVANALADRLSGSHPHEGAEAAE